MRNTIRRILAVVMIVALACGAVSLAAAENYGYIPKKAHAAKLAVHEDSRCGLARGGKIQLTMTGPDGTALEGVTFHSAKTSVATVNANGTVRAKKPGKVRITMKAATGERYTLTVTVADPAAPDKISFNRQVYQTWVGMEEDMTAMLEAKPFTEALNLKTLTWSSSNVRIATVDKNGVLVAQGPGRATITVRTQNGKTASMAVQVDRNLADNLQPTPPMTAIDFGEAIFLKSVEITHPGVVACEYWLLFKHYPTVRSTYFSWVEDHISVTGKDTAIEIVDGSALNIKCRTKGQTLKLFKVTYRGDAVKNMNIRLSKYRNKITWDSSFWLNWKY